LAQEHGLEERFNLRYYAGIGSRETPENILDLMGTIAERLYARGYTLRSGSAPGADLAFEKAVADLHIFQSSPVPAEIYLPWKSFQEKERTWIPPARDEPQPEAFEIAAAYHPRWRYLNFAAKKLHARNVHQVLGFDVMNPDPADFVICWTKMAKGEGGTGQAIRIAGGYNVPVYDLGHDQGLEELKLRVNGSFVI